VLEIGTDPVHLVDERDSGNAVLVRLPPDRLGLRLDAAHGTEQGHGSIEHAEAAFHFHGEIDVTGRVDDVDLVLVLEPVPERRRGRGRDRDAALLLLLHPVHRGVAVMYLAHPMHPARVVQDALGRRGLTGIDVSHDADIPELVELRAARHLS
jgi:hypothetical protein